VCVEIGVFTNKEAPSSEESIGVKLSQEKAEADKKKLL
jgi:hypothetical protein